MIFYLKKLNYKKMHELMDSLKKKNYDYEFSPEDSFYSGKFRF